jgi:hypothetical protein
MGIIVSGTDWAHSDNPRPTRREFPTIRAAVKRSIELIDKYTTDLSSVVTDVIVRHETAQTVVQFARSDDAFGLWTGIIVTCDNLYEAEVVEYALLDRLCGGAS